MILEQVRPILFLCAQTENREPLRCRDDFLISMSARNLTGQATGTRFIFSCKKHSIDLNI